MEIKLAGNLKMEMDIPMLRVVSFHYCWKPDCHALLKLEGYIDRSFRWDPGQSYSSRVKVWLESDGKMQAIYHGYIVEAEIKNIGNTSQLFIEAMSASCLLDRQISSRSFLDPAKTYGEVVREAVQAEGGQVIRNQGSDKKTGSPVIRYEETAWQFVERLGRRLGNYIIPDIETGYPNLWFGMRKGNDVPALSEEQCTVEICSIGRKAGIRFQAEGRNYYKIGDQMTYLGHKVIIVEVKGSYEQGELVFTYTLEIMEVCQAGSQHENHPAGLGLWGSIREIKGESVKIALDIDQGMDTGDYFFPWYPETGNALYAMPEVGARALLYFFGADEQEGAVIHCLNREQEEARSYKDRAMDIEDGNSISLSMETVRFSKGGSHRLSLSDHAITISTSKELKIAAEGKVRLRARQITISTPDELNICQG
ncbi:contractile injection system protein, VgrG/Pvc8 family [Lacrimispora sp.]|uniref:contractile injection system protein, VgrG/Pvc8 family n=2 Tax=Lacrimispora sp. TaxID=2719234 RepID=UPI00289D334F|nr:contractile injection system protein, VgrG/Pvc8 family [Lacrimispora sp.]